VKVVAFNGSARANGNTALLLSTVLAEIAAAGIDTEIYHLAGKPLQGCVGCFQCFKNKDRRCAVDKDVINECVAKMDAADGILLGSPTYFADVSAAMKALIERSGMVARANPDLLRRKVGAAVVAVRRAGAFHAFASLNAFFQISGMVVPGASYWNIGRGREPGEVAGDDEGMHTMRDLGQNVAWLLPRVRGA
jgi:multimeric flavodoxin WrbA